MQATTYLDQTRQHPDRSAIGFLLRRLRSERRFDSLALGIGFCAVPVSIALTEIFLGIALLARVVRICRRQARLRVPRVFWYWSIWAALEIAVWLHSPDRRAGTGEIRHLLLIAALFLVMPASGPAMFRVAIWRGIFVTATLGSAALIADFGRRLIVYSREISTTTDASFYLRSGGLLHHWMIYASVEVMVFAALLEYWQQYREERGRLLIALLVNSVAILLSLTRMLWLSCLLMLAVHLLRRRSRWIWALPLGLFVLVTLAPQALRYRITTAIRPDYYSNAERVQMLGVGYKMILQHPLAGVGPGRVEAFYPTYLSESSHLPAYYGHLHNDAVQLAAQFGLPVLGAAVLFLAMLVKDLRKSARGAIFRRPRFLLPFGAAGTCRIPVHRYDRLQLRPFPRTDSVQFCGCVPARLSYRVKSLTGYTPHSPHSGIAPASGHLRCPMPPTPPAREKGFEACAAAVRVVLVSPGVAEHRHINTAFAPTADPVHWLPPVGILR